MSVHTPSSLEYLLTESDLEAFAVHHVQHAPHLATRIRRMRLVWAVVFTVIALEYARTSPIGALGFVGIAITYLAFYGPINRHLYLRQTRGLRRAYTPGVGPVALTLESDTLTIAATNGTARLESSAIRRIEESPAHYFLYVGSAAAIVVPRSGVLNGDPEAFVRAVGAKMPTA